MRHDDDRLFDDDDNDLWDDELELNSYTQEPMEYPLDDYSISHTDTDDPITAHDDDRDDYYSEPETAPEPSPEPKESPRSRRGRGGFFGRSAEEEDDEGNDYYDSDTDPEPEPVRKPKTPRLNPEDPDYWISDEEPVIGRIISNTGKKWKWRIAVACALLILLSGIWIWFFRPYTDNAVKYGYIVEMERRGSIIKTFEGTMIPYKELGDPDPLYFQKLPFSVAGDSVAALMKRMMLGCVPVRIEYEVYHSPLPWKGEQKVVVLKADSTDPRKILPPEYRPK